MNQYDKRAEFSTVNIIFKLFCVFDLIDFVFFFSNSNGNTLDTLCK